MMICIGETPIRNPNKKLQEMKPGKENMYETRKGKRQCKKRIKRETEETGRIPRKGRVRLSACPSPLGLVLGVFRGCAHFSHVFDDGPSSASLVFLMALGPAGSVASPSVPPSSHRFSLHVHTTGGASEEKVDFSIKKVKKTAQKILLNYSLLIYGWREHLHSDWGHTTEMISNYYFLLIFATWLWNTSGQAIFGANWMV
uniref:Uncharacterized protein n=1 Tax=Romanomermis culicivorax TaxID=13658 RepID=A0A915J620_ROMCU